MTLTHFDKNHWTTFARDLVTTGELDPPYVLIDAGRSKYGKEWTERFAMHYFLFYDLGGAAECAKSEVPFWDYVKTGYANFKRGKPRRHFRGDKGLAACDRLSIAGPTAGNAFNAMYRDDYNSLALHIQDHFPGCEIGPYFTWKLMDIFDRCLGRPVWLDLKTTLKHLPEVPRKGAKSFFPDKSLEVTLNTVTEAIWNIAPPGAFTRMCGLPEAETILCAIHGINKGTYRFGEDLDHRHKELAAFPDLIALLPPIRDWSKYATGPLVS